MCKVVRLYIVVMSGEVVCSSVVCGTLAGVSVISIMCFELMNMSDIILPLWLSVHEHQSVRSRHL